MSSKRNSFELNDDENQKQQNNSENIINSNNTTQENGIESAHANNIAQKLEQESVNNAPNQIVNSNSSNNLKQASLNVPVSRWSIEKTLEWLNRKAPNVYENYREYFIQHQITGEILLELNNDTLEELKITESNLRDQLLDEISILKIKNEYEFVKRFKSNDSSS